MNTIENGFSLRQPESLNGLLENSKSRIYSRLLLLDSASLQILKAVGENSGIKSRELEEKVKLSRAPILQRTKKMSGEELLARSVVPGTETHSKPAYSYTLPSNLTLVAISCAIAKLSVDEYLNLENKGSDRTAVPQKHQPSKSSFSTLESFQELLEAAFKKISELENRLCQVENALRHPSTFDREKLLDMLNPNKD